MYSTRGALALLWRGAIGDQSGSQLWSPDELDCAASLHESGLGELVVRYVPRDGKMTECHFFVLTGKGRETWEKLLLDIEDAQSDGAAARERRAIEEA